MTPATPSGRSTPLRWQWKAIIPIIGVLLLGLVAFQAIVLALNIPNGHWILIVAAAGALAICFVTLSVLLVLIERPLHELKETIARVREGDLAARVEFAKRSDDVGQLGRQFNEMIQQLAENRAEIERLHQREMARAEHLATIGELAAGLAHEIRNPLAGIAGVVEVIGKELPAQSASRAVLPEVQGEIQHIQTILNDLLAYARPRSPAFHLADLNATIEQAVFLARQQVRTAPIEISFAPQEDLPEVVHDPVQIQQVILNLLINGIQAIPKEGKVEVTSRREGEFAVVSVKDTGKGISRDSLPRIFKPFFTTRAEGTGLGLPLAKGIVESHGGRIEVKSEANCGAQFDVLLPIARLRDEHANA
jgi:two-component system NtrC family sensor kinase